jgi:hypothetical protein
LEFGLVNRVHGNGQVGFVPLEKGRQDDLPPGASHVLGFTKWIDRLRVLVPSPGGRAAALFLKNALKALKQAAENANSLKGTAFRPSITAL